MRYLSVCSGIEAATQAWHPLGWECAGVSEIEPFPRAVLEQRLGAVAVDDDHRWREGSNTIPLFGDFTKIEAHHVGPVDLLVGGTPCQSFSIAGKRLGLDDPRGNLTLEFLALARRVRPRWIVWENVPGVLSHDDGRTMGTFLRLVGECGFRWAYRVLDAQYVRVGRFGRAVPQRRRRVFLVGYSGAGELDPRAVLFDRESLRGNPAPRREAGQGTAADVAGCLATGGGGRAFPGTCAQDALSGYLIALSSGQANAEIRTDGGAATLNCLHEAPIVAHALRGEGFDASEDGTGRGTPLVPVQHVEREVAGTLMSYAKSGGDSNRIDNAYAGQMVPIAFDALACGNTGHAASEDVVGALHGGGKHGGRAAIAFDMRGREGGAMPEGPHDTANIRAASGGSSRSYVAQTWGVRRLTPRECERLQAFPDDFTKIEWRGKPADQCPDGPRYKALGNSMAVNVMAWIGERIAAVEAVAQDEKAEAA